MLSVKMSFSGDVVKLHSSDKEAIGAALAAIGLVVWPGFLLSETGRESYSNVQPNELGNWEALMARKDFYTDEVHNKVSKILNVVDVDLELELDC